MSQYVEGDQYGVVTLDPADAIVAGQYGTWHLTYTCGSNHLPVGSCLHIYTDSDTDWEMPQFLDPAAPDYMTLQTPDGVQAMVKAINLKKLVVVLGGRELQSGEQLKVVFGDPGDGNPGTRAQTFIDQRRYFWVDVELPDQQERFTLAHSPHLSVVGDQPVKLVVTVPSTLSIGEGFRLLLKAEDQWGNPAHGYTGTVRFQAELIRLPADQFELGPGEATLWIDGCQAIQSGTCTVQALEEEHGLVGESNPVVITETPAPQQLLWADPHGGQLVLNSKIGEFYRYARDVAGIHFVGYQRNADVISAEDWEVQQQEEVAFHEPGVFVPIPGYEWSGRTWEGGHHNIYFRRHGQSARRNAAAETMFRSERVTAELLHVRDVYDAYRNTDVIITPHVGGQHSDIQFHDPSLEPAVEIVSSHGAFEWMLRDSIERGYHMGFLGGSDSYTGRPGDDRPGYQTRRYSKAGLTGIYAQDVTLDSFFEAMRARRVYATTGARLIVGLESDGNWMGSEYATDSAPTIRASVTGTAPLEKVELFRGLECIGQAPLDVQGAPNRVRILWAGSSRMMSYSGVIWDGSLCLHGARIKEVSCQRFDSPRSAIREQDEQSLNWQVWGCGYPMAIDLDLEFDDASEVSLQLSVGTRLITGPGFGGHGEHGPMRMSRAPAEQCSIQVGLAEIQQQVQQYSLGVLDRLIRIGPVPTGQQTQVSWEMRDESPQAGWQPYWLRVTQQDLEMAWSSPVFVDYVE
ncbi:MAG: DUF3604 domain-containing protein [Pirellulaceae bacterium]